MFRLVVVITYIKRAYFANYCIFFLCCQIDKAKGNNTASERILTKHLDEYDKE